MTAVKLLNPVDAVPSNPLWHKLRATGVSASEIAAVLGISPWESPFSLYWRKKENLPVDVNDAMRAGVYAEPVVADWWADECDPLENLVIERAGLYAHHERRWQLATPDRLIYLDCAACASHDMADGAMRCLGDHGMKPVALLECKYLPGGWDGWGEPNTDEVPVYYRAQCLWQLDVLEVDQVYLAAWHGAEFRCYLVRRDEKDLRVMRAAGAAFMDRLNSDDPPPLDGHEATVRTLRQLHPDLEDATVDVDAATAAGYRRARALKASAERLLSTFEARLRAQMGSARYAEHDRQRVATRVIAEVAESTRTVAAHRRDYLLAPRSKK